MSKTKVFQQGEALLVRLFDRETFDACRDSLDWRSVFDWVERAEALAEMSVLDAKTKAEAKQAKLLHKDVATYLDKHRSTVYEPVSKPLTIGDSGEWSEEELDRYQEIAVPDGGNPAHFTSDVLLDEYMAEEWTEGAVEALMIREGEAHVESLVVATLVDAHLADIEGDETKYHALFDEAADIAYLSAVSTEAFNVLDYAAKEEAEAIFAEVSEVHDAEAAEASLAILNKPSEPVQELVPIGDGYYAPRFQDTHRIEVERVIGGTVITQRFKTFIPHKWKDWSVRIVLVPAGSR